LTVDVVDLPPVQHERDPQLDQRKDPALPGEHAVGGRVDVVHVAGTRGGQFVARGTVHVHDPPRGQVPLQRAGGLLPDLGPGGIGDRCELAVQVIHRRVPLSGCRC
jgi:hypothetical protein